MPSDYPTIINCYDKHSKMNILASTPSPACGYFVLMGHGWEHWSHLGVTCPALECYISSLSPAAGRAASCPCVPLPSESDSFCATWRPFPCGLAASLSPLAHIAEVPAAFRIGLPEI